MAEILITGIEMPKGNNIIIVDSAGTITKLNTWTGKREATDPLKVKAQELPPHEHLTEKSAFWNMLHEICVKCNDSGDIDRYQNRCIWCKIKEAYEKVYQTPTVLEAST